MKFLWEKKKIIIKNHPTLPASWGVGASSCMQPPPHPQSSTWTHCPATARHRGWPGWALLPSTLALQHPCASPSPSLFSPALLLSSTRSSCGFGCACSHHDVRDVGCAGSHRGSMLLWCPKEDARSVLPLWKPVDVKPPFWKRPSKFYQPGALAVNGFAPSVNTAINSQTVIRGLPSTDKSAYSVLVQ